MRFINTSLLIIMFATMLTACSSTPIKMHFQSAQYLNPDFLNRSLPVQVKIYQLRADNTFLQATFRELWQQDAATLGNDMLNKHELIISPGRQVNTILTRNKECRYIGVIAIFRKPQESDWRVVEKVVRKLPLIAAKMKITLRGYKIILQQ